jgi:hypothetical protein
MIKSRRNPTVHNPGPIMSKRSPARQDEVDPPASTDETTTSESDAKWNEGIDIFLGIHDQQLASKREDTWNLEKKEEKGGTFIPSYVNEKRKEIVDYIRNNKDATIEDVRKITKTYLKELNNLQVDARSGSRKIIKHSDADIAKAKKSLSSGAYAHLLHSRTNPKKEKTTTTVEAKGGEGAYVYSLAPEKFAYAQKKWGHGVLSPKLDKERDAYYRENNIMSYAQEQGFKYDDETPYDPQSAKERDASYPEITQRKANNPPVTQGNDPIKRAGFKKLKFGRRK